jgi:DMSO/TMAO reductase YedYZ molybdopterin-dependent catalytic subunit
MSLSRRAFLATVIDRMTTPPAVASPSDLITPTSAFFRQYSAIPQRRAAHWGFSIGGSVTHPLSLSYGDLLAMPAVEMPCTLLCAANDPGGERIGHAVWRGVPLAALLEDVEIDTTAGYARLSAADGHTTSITLKQLRGSLLAYVMNGETLTPEQGFPARLIVPGLYDYKSPRWIQRIEITDSPTLGGWEAHGWSQDGNVRAVSGITRPRPFEAVAAPVRLEGYAYAGKHEIVSVELSVDDGAWMAVDVSEHVPHSWARWQAEWPAPSTGDFVVRVRATDSSGFMQPAQAAFPYRSSAIQTTVIRVVALR